MKHIIKSNLYLIFWSEKFFNLAILAGMVVLLMVLQGHFAAYVIGIYLSTFMCLLKMNSMDSRHKYENINASMPEQKENIIFSRFLTAGAIIVLVTVVNLAVAIWANTKKVIYDGKGMNEEIIPKIMIEISTSGDELFGGIILGILLAVIFSGIYIYLWSKINSDKYNLYVTMIVLISIFSIKPILQGVTDQGISLIAVNILFLVVAIVIGYFSFIMSKKAFSQREF
ncbi:MAG: ABC-2 transporter permease [Candidatus Delongbacteria bacterium]|jgi:hypothetical protein|nr:ABC-2 transporter permease [Candidatus Delongbacteria bacterium]